MESAIQVQAGPYGPCVSWLGHRQPLLRCLPGCLGSMPLLGALILKSPRQLSKACRPAKFVPSRPVWLSNMWQPVPMSMLPSMLHMTSHLPRGASQSMWPLQVSWITQEINLTAASAAIMSRMPIANQAAFQVGLMVRLAAVWLPHLVACTDV